MLYYSPKFEQAGIDNMNRTVLSLLGVCGGECEKFCGDFQNYDWIIYFDVDSIEQRKYSLIS